MNISLNHVIKSTYKQKAELYLDVLQKLKEKKIEYIIINLPIYYTNNKIPNDIDIVLDYHNYNKAKNILLNSGFVKLDRFINSNQEAYICYYPDKCEFIMIHLHLNFSFYGIDILSYNEIKENVFENDGFLYPNKRYESVILLFESFFRKKFHYYDRIDEQNNDFINMKFNDKRVDRLFNVLLDFYNKKQNVSTKQQISVMLNVYGVSVLKYLIKKMVIIFSKFNILKRKGKLVFIVGIDGSGKSTISEEVVKKIESGGYLSKYSYWGLKVTLVQKIKNLLKKKKSNNNSSDSKHHIKLNNGIVEKINKKSKLLGNLFYFILSIAYIIDYWILIFKDLTFISSENNFLIVDRTYYDKLFDTTKIANKLFFYLLPKPDLIVRLNGDLEVFYNRKKEFSIKDLQILNNRVDNIIKFSKTKNINIFEVDTTKNSIKESTCKIVKYLWEKL